MKSIFLSAFCLLILSNSFAQISDPGAYLSKITEKQTQITEESMGYVSAVAHGKSARKIEKRRTELINAILQARAMAKNMAAYQGDTSLRAAAYEYFNITYLVIKEDYGKIVDLEEIAEQTYDNMEAYLLAQDLASKKLSDAYDKVDREFNAFAAKNNINLLKDESKLSKMSQVVGKVHDYYHEVYLIFFKSYKQEIYLLEALEKKDVNGIEQNKNALIKTTEEGLAKLAKLSSFEGDADLAAVCRLLLQFYQNEAKNKVAISTSYFLKNESFEKLNKAMQSKPASQQSEVDINAYNAAVKEINSAVNVYNKNNKELGENRNKLINDWNNSAQAFLSKHTPRYNK
jgi:hypothetical protein